MTLQTKLKLQILINLLRYSKKEIKESYRALIKRKMEISPEEWYPDKHKSFAEFSIKK